MLRQLASPVAAAARDGMNRGIASFARTLLVAGIGAAGTGLLLASALIGLSRLIGPLLACGAMGLGLIVLAALIGSLQHKHPVSVPDHAQVHDQLAFAFGFVLARWLLAKRD